jgi:hypothetical protein
MNFRKNFDNLNHGIPDIDTNEQISEWLDEIIKVQDLLIKRNNSHTEENINELRRSARIRNQSKRIDDKIKTNSQKISVVPAQKAIIDRAIRMDRMAADLSQVTLHKMQPFNIKCSACKTIWSRDELPINYDKPFFFKCCDWGKIKVYFPDIPNLLRELFIGIHRYSEHFLKEIIAYNSSYSFASFNVDNDRSYYNDRPDNRTNFIGGGSI